MCNLKANLLNKTRTHKCYNNWFIEQDINHSRNFFDSFSQIEIDDK